MAAPSSASIPPACSCWWPSPGTRPARGKPVRWTAASPELLRAAASGWVLTELLGLADAASGSNAREHRPRPVPRRLLRGELRSPRHHGRRAAAARARRSRLRDGQHDLPRGPFHQGRRRHVRLQRRSPRSRIRSRRCSTSCAPARMEVTAPICEGLLQSVDQIRAMMHRDAEAAAARSLGIATRCRHSSGRSLSRSRRGLPRPRPAARACRASASGRREARRAVPPAATGTTPLAASASRRCRSC